MDAENVHVIGDFNDPDASTWIKRQEKRESKCMCICFGLLVVTVLFGLALLYRFDPRTGWFVMSTSPVVALLVFVCSGAWRPIEKVN